jgi:hypothetical protein
LDFHGISSFSAVFIINDLRYNSRTMERGGLGPKRLRGNRFYKGHRDIAETALSKSLYLKSLASLKKPRFLKTPFLWKCLEKASLCL